MLSRTLDIGCSSELMYSQWWRYIAAVLTYQDTVIDSSAALPLNIAGEIMGSQGEYPTRRSYYGHITVSTFYRGQEARW